MPKHTDINYSSSLSNIAPSPLLPYVQIYSSKLQALEATYTVYFKKKTYYIQFAQQVSATLAYYYKPCKHHYWCKELYMACHIQLIFLLLHFGA